MKNALYPLKGISAKLQKRELDIYDAYMRIDDTISLLQAFRGDVDTFHERVYEEAKQLAELIGSIEEKPRTVRAGMRQEHRSNVPAESISEYFKRSIMIPFLDYIISEMKTRFSKTNRLAVICVLSLIPKEVIRRTPLPSEFEFYRDDLPSYTTLQSEIEQWIHYWKHRSTAADLPDNIIGCLKYADGDVFPNIRILFTIGSVFPVTSSEAERTFSVLRRIKTTLRNRMDEERLASLTLVHINHHIPVTADCIVDRFVPEGSFDRCMWTKRPFSEFEFRHEYSSMHCNSSRCT